MTDGELLDAAAKAAGIGDLAVYGHFNKRDWNPLDNDGDAFRLKVSLHLIVGSYATYTSVSGTFAPNGYAVPDDVVVWHSETGGDACAAERLAITRCAAAIADAMPASGAVGAA